MINYNTLDLNVFAFVTDLIIKEIIKNMTTRLLCLKSLKESARRM